MLSEQKLYFVYLLKLNLGCILAFEYNTYNALYKIIYTYFARTFNQVQCTVTKYCNFMTAFCSETLE